MRRERAGVAPREEEEQNQVGYSAGNRTGRVRLSAPLSREELQKSTGPDLDRVLQGTRFLQRIRFVYLKEPAVSRKFQNRSKNLVSLIRNISCSLKVLLTS